MRARGAQRRRWHPQRGTEQALAECQGLPVRHRQLRRAPDGDRRATGVVADARGAASGEGHGVLTDHPERRPTLSARRFGDTVARRAVAADHQLVDHRLDVVDAAHRALERLALRLRRDAALQIDPAPLATTRCGVGKAFACAMNWRTRTISGRQVRVRQPRPGGEAVCRVRPRAPGPASSACVTGPSGPGSRAAPSGRTNVRRSSAARPAARRRARHRACGGACSAAATARARAAMNVCPAVMRTLCPSRSQTRHPAPDHRSRATPFAPMRLRPPPRDLPKWTAPPSRAPARLARTSRAEPGDAGDQRDSPSGSELPGSRIYGFSSPVPDPMGRSATASAAQDPLMARPRSDLLGVAAFRTAAMLMRAGAARRRRATLARRPSLIRNMCHYSPRAIPDGMVGSDLIGGAIGPLVGGACGFFFWGSVFLSRPVW